MHSLWEEGHSEHLGGLQNAALDMKVSMHAQNSNSELLGCPANLMGISSMCRMSTSKENSDMEITKVFRMFIKHMVYVHYFWGKGHSEHLGGLRNTALDVKVSAHARNPRSELLGC